MAVNALPTTNDVTEDLDHLQLPHTAVDANMRPTGRVHKEERPQHTAVDVDLRSTGEDHENDQLQYTALNFLSADDDPTNAKGNPNDSRGCHPHLAAKRTISRHADSDSSPTSSRGHHRHWTIKPTVRLFLGQHIWVTVCMWCGL